MTTPVHITDGDGSKTKAGVTKIGQLVVGAYAYDETKFISLAVDNTAYTFYPPKANQQFVITGIRAKANRNVSNSADATVIFYESDGEDSLVVTKVLHEEAFINGEAVTLMPVNILVGKGKFVNGKTSDNIVFATILGYYIPELGD